MFRDERFGFHAAMIPPTAPSLGSQDVNHRIWSWRSVFSFLASLLLGTAARLRSVELRRGSLRPYTVPVLPAVARSAAEGEGWSQLSDSNRRPTVYKTETAFFQKHAKTPYKGLFIGVPCMFTNPHLRHVKTLLRHFSCRKV